MRLEGSSRSRSGGGESALGRGRGETLWDTGYDGPLGDNGIDIDDTVDNDDLSSDENDRDDDGDDRDDNVSNIGEGDAGGGAGAGAGAGGERDPPRFRSIVSYVGRCCAAVSYATASYVWSVKFEEGGAGGKVLVRRRHRQRHVPPIGIGGDSPPR